MLIWQCGGSTTFDYTIKMAKGAGIQLGLSFIVNDIKCGWLNAAGFEGSRVKTCIKIKYF